MEIAGGKKTKINLNRHESMEHLAHIQLGSQIGVKGRVENKKLSRH